MLIDTHAHLHLDEYADTRDAVLTRARANHVDQIVTVGTDASDSQRAVELATRYDQVYATVGLHPHEAKHSDQIAKLKSLATDPKVVAIGECGLDYFKNFSAKSDQIKAFHQQIELAIDLKKPMVWHVRDAFSDFFEIVDQYPGLTGIVHCFNSHREDLDQAIKRGFYVAFNGIMTFTKDQSQLDTVMACPLNRMVLETDCPFLTPAPKRGQINEPANLKLIVEFIARLRDEDTLELSKATSKNARTVFGLA